MVRLLPLLVCPLLLGFAPLPAPRVISDPDRAIQRFGQQAEHCGSCDDSTLAGRKKRLLDGLRDLQERLERQGDLTAAAAVRDRLLLAEDIGAGKPLGSQKPTDLIRTASADGKYRHLMHVLHVPTDQASCQKFLDFGHWAGTTYAGRSDLQPGYWVYVAPRWYVWREGPPLQR